MSKFGNFVNSLRNAQLEILFSTVRNDHPNLVKILFFLGVAKQIRDQKGNCLLHSCPNQNMGKLLLENGIPINARNDMAQTALHTAMRNKVYLNKRLGLHDFALLLIASGIDVNAQENNGFTALHLAEHLDIVQALLISGANPNIKDNNNDTPLHIATRRLKDPRIIAALIAAGADRTLQNNIGHAASDELQKLFSSIKVTLEERKKMATINEILNMQTVASADDEVPTMMYLAPGAPSEDTIDPIIEAPQLEDTTDNLDSDNSADDTSTFCAFDQISLTSVMRNSVYTNLRPALSVLALELIGNGADVNEQEDDTGMAPLHLAENILIANALLEHGAYVDIQDHVGDTPLHVAIRIPKDIQIIASLIRAGADTDIENNAGETPLDVLAKLAERPNVPKNIVRLINDIVHPVAHPNDSTNETQALVTDDEPEEPTTNVVDTPTNTLTTAFNTHKKRHHRHDGHAHTRRPHHNHHRKVRA